MDTLGRNRDVVVIGGGPAGACTATLLAGLGHDVLVLERDQFPRFKIGESLMPATYWTLERLGLLEKMKATAFPRKYSVQFFGEGGQAFAPFYFRENDPRDCAVTWQVLRSDFDQLLIDNARSRGAEVIHGANVRDLLLNGDRVQGVRVAVGDKAPVDVTARVVVDASGQSALLGRKLGLIETDPCLRHAAVFTHYQGGARDDGDDEGATLILHTSGKRSWFWYIPMPDDRVSVGVVGAVDHLLRDRGRDPQAVFDRELDGCPALKPRLAQASQTMPMRVMRDFSYAAKQIAGDGWVMVGDAFGFLDPIYSSGVLLALRSGEFAADAIDEALTAGDVSGARLGAFHDRFAAGMDALKRLVYAFYTPGFSFARFLKKHPEFRKDVIDLLTGDVFDRDHEPLFAAMAPFVETLERDVLATEPAS